MNYRLEGHHIENQVPSINTNTPIYDPTEDIRILDLEAPIFRIYSLVYLATWLDQAYEKLYDNVTN